MHSDGVVATHAHFCIFVQFSIIFTVNKHYVAHTQIVCQFHKSSPVIETNLGTNTLARKALTALIIFHCWVIPHRRRPLHCPYTAWITTFCNRLPCSLKLSEMSHTQRQKMFETGSAFDSTNVDKILVSSQLKTNNTAPHNAIQMSTSMFVLD